MKKVHLRPHHPEDVEEAYQIIEPELVTSRRITRLALNSKEKGEFK